MGGNDQSDDLANKAMAFFVYYFGLASQGQPLKYSEMVKGLETLYGKDVGNGIIPQLQKENLIEVKKVRNSTEDYVELADAGRDFHKNIQGMVKSVPNHYYVQCAACTKVHKLEITMKQGDVVAQLYGGLKQNRPLAFSPTTQNATLSYLCPSVTEESVLVTVILPVNRAAEASISQIDVHPPPTNQQIYPTSLPNPQQNALLEFSKNAIVNSMGVLKDFISFMVPLTTLLITAYFALLEFMGVKTLADIPTVTTSYYIIPPIIMLVSLGLFIWAAFPIKGTIVGGNLDSIRKYRENTFYRKYKPSIIGGLFFIAGIFSMIIVIMPLLATNNSVEPGTQENFSIYNNNKYDYRIQYPSFASVDVSNNSKSVTFYLPGDTKEAKLKVGIEEFQTVPRLDQYIMKRIAILGGGLTSFSTLDNTAAYTINSTSTIGFELLAIKNKKAYLLDFEANKTNYGIYNPIVQEMIRSFKFID